MKTHAFFPSFTNGTPQIPAESEILRDGLRRCIVKNGYFEAFSVGYFEIWVRIWVRR
jgi:hypothetical protein